MRCRTGFYVNANKLRTNYVRFVEKSLNYFRGKTVENSPAIDASVAGKKTYPACNIYS